MALLIPQEEAVVAVQRGAQLPPPRGGDGLQHVVEAGDVLLVDYHGEGAVVEQPRPRLGLGLGLGLEL